MSKIALKRNLLIYKSLKTIINITIQLKRGLIKMDKENIDYEIRIIKDAFDEKRNIIGYAPKEKIKVNKDCHQGGDIFITDEGELIDLEYQMQDFDEEELAKYVELAEELYEINKVSISIYVLCPRTLKVIAPECTIKSEAEFTIKLACWGENPVYEMFFQIKEKIDKNIRLNDEDILNLEMIPLRVPKEERRTFRVECFKLLNKAIR